jgi:hypothetical protein
MPLNAIKENVGNFLQSDGLQNLKTQAAGGLSSVGEGLKGLGAQASDFAQSDDMKALLPYLLSGGTAAAIGGMTTGRQRKEKGEERSGYLGRVLRNALIAGGLGAGGHYLVNKGLDSTVGGLRAVEGGDGEVTRGPTETLLKNVAFSPLTAAGAGASALYATHKMPGIGAGDTKDFMNAMVADNKGHFAAMGGKGDLTESRLRAMTARQIGDLERHAMAAGPYSDRARRMAGLASDVVEPRHGLDKLPQGLLDRLPGVKGAGGRDEQLRALKGFLSTAKRKHLGSTLGQSNIRRAGRGALGLAAAGLPALLGSFVTRE